MRKNGGKVPAVVRRSPLIGFAFLRLVRLDADPPGWVVELSAGLELRPR